MSHISNEQLSEVRQLKDLEDGQFLKGDSEAPFAPPEGFDMAKFHRGRRLFQRHLFCCLTYQLFALVVGLTTPEFLEVLIFTEKSDTPEKALRRYNETLWHVVQWHYGNVWEEGSEAQKSIRYVRYVHRAVREKISKKNKDLNARKYVSQYDMGVVMSGFVGGIILHPEDVGITNSLNDLDDYIYFWYGLGHLLGIEEKYNICANGLKQAVIYCKNIEQTIIHKNLVKSHPDYVRMAEAVVNGYQQSLWFLPVFTLPTIVAVTKSLMRFGSWKLSVADTIRFYIWKMVFLLVRYLPGFQKGLNYIIEHKVKIKFTEI